MIITEGTTNLKVHLSDIPKKSDPVFYNKVMQMSRDISIAAVGILKPERFCDLLSGTGARGVRVANETSCPSVVLNDANPNAYRIINENLDLNSLSHPVVKNLNANLLLAEYTSCGDLFDFVDIDPFGSPVRFIDSAVSSLKRGGVLAITATDTGALCGTYPAACRRRYDAIPLKNEFYNETGLRILIGYAARAALRRERGISVLFSHCTSHYFRSYIMLGPKKYIKDTIKNLAFIQYCPVCMHRHYTSLSDIEKQCACGGLFKNAGVVWSGNFADIEFCENLKNEISEGVFNTKKEALKLIDLAAGEQGITKPYYDIHKICKLLKIPAPSMDAVMGNLEKKGIASARSHFCGTGLRCGEDIGEIVNVIK